LFVLVIDGDGFLGPMNFKMLDESIHVIAPSKRTANPQELKDFRGLSWASADEFAHCKPLVYQQTSSTLATC
jgi:hypothetical protein